MTHLKIVFEVLSQIRMISYFCCKVDENRTLLRYYAACSNSTEKCGSEIYDMRFEVLIGVNIKAAFLQDVTLCNLIES